LITTQPWPPIVFATALFRVPPTPTPDAHAGAAAAFASRIEKLRSGSATKNVAINATATTWRNTPLRNI
jgi:hypothetical protein